MYPREPLELLEAKKSVLLARSALHRAECAEACARIAEPLEKIDAWRSRLKPLRMLWPLGAAALRDRVGQNRNPERHGWRRWVPFAVNVVRSAAKL